MTQAAWAPCRGSVYITALLLLSLTVGCASMGISQTRNYRLVPPADFAPALAAATPVGGLAAPRTDQSVGEWTADWMEGPVSSIATTEEFDKYARLDSDVERAEFIRLFWERRDPEPEESYNESLEEFDRRLAVANALFSTEKRPGWRSVFGRTLLTLGFPTVVRVGDEDGPRAMTTEVTEAKSGDRVFWQYGLRPEDLAGTSLGMARLMSTDTVAALSAQSATQFLSFTYWRGGWGLICNRGWLVSTLDDSWSGGRGIPNTTASGTGANQQGTSLDTGVGETMSPDVAGSGGVYMSGGGGGGGGAPIIRRTSFGAGCSDVFRDARSAWLFNTVRYP